MFQTSLKTNYEKEKLTDGLKKTIRAPALPKKCPSGKIASGQETSAVFFLRK